MASQVQVGSVAKALEIVESVVGAASSGMTLAEIAKSVGGSKSAVLATLRTLVDFGYLRVVEQGPTYLPGMMLIRLGDLAAANDPLVTIARPILAELSKKSGLTIRVARNDNGYPVFLDRVDGPGVVRFYTPLGVRELPHVSSAGKAILAQLPDRRIDEISEETGLTARTEHSITTPAKLRREIEKIRKRGWATDDEEDALGIFCLGAPIFNYSGSCLGAISATGVKTNLSDEQVNKLGKLILKYADSLTKELGGKRVGVR